MRLGPVFAALLLTGMGVGGWYWAKQPPAPKADAFTKRSGGGRGGQNEPPVPVTVAIVAAQNMSVYRDGIGNVVAIASVTVRAQIDGRLMSVGFTEGQTLKKGDLIAKIDPITFQALYDQAVAKKAQDVATLANAKLDLDRYVRLAQTNAGPKQQADQQRATVAQLEAQVKSDDAAIQNAKAVLDYTTISSPIDGRAGLRLVDPGNIVHAGDASGIVTVTQLQPIAIVFTLPQRDLASVTKAMAAGSNIAVEVMQADGSGVLAAGKLETIDNQIDTTTGTIKLKAVFANTDMMLWPGQFVAARVAVESMNGAKVVPTAAVRRGPIGTFVYAVGADSKVAVTPVKVLMQDDRIAVLGDGPPLGAQVVTVGFNRLADGKTVNVVGGQPAQPLPTTPKSSAETGSAPPASDGAAEAKGERKRGEGLKGKGDGEVKGTGEGKGRRKREGQAGQGGPAGVEPARGDPPVIPAAVIPPLPASPIPGPRP